eukprot:scaffold16237_cov112-Isochrysis_galbana.AAC.2
MGGAAMSHAPPIKTVATSTNSPIGRREPDWRTQRKRCTATTLLLFIRDVALIIANGPKYLVHGLQGREAGGAVSPPV